VYESIVKTVDTKHLTKTMLLSTKANGTNQLIDLPILKLKFQQLISKKRLRFFRKAVEEQIQTYTSSISTQSGNDQTGNTNFYPLIQYQYDAGYPQILAIGQGITAIQSAFQETELVSVQLNDELVEFRLSTADLEQAKAGVQQTWTNYKIEEWIALNPQNYKSFKKIKSVHEQQQFLERKLKAHILAFAKGINWHIKERIELEISEISEAKAVSYRTATVLAFQIEFSCNMQLPEEIGLGKGVSFGFGRLEKI
jgi:hypothetical protein